MYFSSFVEVPSFPSIMSFKSFGDLRDNVYIQLVIVIVNLSPLVVRVSKLGKL